MVFQSGLAATEATGYFEFFWFVFVLNVGLFLLVVVLLRLAYSTYAACPIHHCEVQYLPSLDAYYCKLCSDYVTSPERIKR
jgi:hypothetical protein